jgi:hypothetical protein
MPSREALSWSRQPRYSRELVEGLVRGYYVDRDTGVPIPEVTWAAQRSRTENTGLVDEEGFAEVLDLERALRLMASPILRSRRDFRMAAEAQAAAMGISAVMLAGFEMSEVKAILGDRYNVDRIFRKGYAWCAAYLSGKDVDACETAFRRTR